MSRKAASSGAAALSGVSTPSDRRFRRPDSRPVRKRSAIRWARLWKPAAAAVASLAIIAAASGVLLSAPGLAVDRVHVRGHTRLSAADIEARLASARGVNILRVDLEAYRAKVLESPWVAEATLWRVLPSTLEVRVVERVPEVLARIGQQLFLMDAAGVLIDELSPSLGALDLPIVDGIATAPTRGGAARVDPARLAVTRRLLDALDARPDLRDRVSQIDATNPHDLVVLLDDDAAYLHVGDEQFVERLTVYLEMAPTLVEQFQDIDYVDLRFEGRLFVRAGGQMGSAATARLRQGYGEAGGKQEARR
jgi:cell division septal protein FtsQ